MPSVLGILPWEIEKHESRTTFVDTGSSFNFRVLHTPGDPLPDEYIRCSFEGTSYFQFLPPSFFVRGLGMFSF